MLAGIDKAIDGPRVHEKGRELCRRGWCNRPTVDDDRLCSVHTYDQRLREQRSQTDPLPDTDRFTASMREMLADLETHWPNMKQAALAVADMAPDVHRERVIRYAYGLYQVEGALPWSRLCCADYLLKCYQADVT